MPHCSGQFSLATTRVDYAPLRQWLKSISISILEILRHIRRQQAATHTRNYLKLHKNRVHAAASWVVCAIILLQYWQSDVEFNGLQPKKGWNKMKELIVLETVWWLPLE